MHCESTVESSSFVKAVSTSLRTARPTTCQWRPQRNIKPLFVFVYFLRSQPPQCHLQRVRDPGPWRLELENHTSESLSDILIQRWIVTISVCLKLSDQIHRQACVSHMLLTSWYVYCSTGVHHLEPEHCVCQIQRKRKRYKAVDPCLGFYPSQCV